MYSEKQHDGDNISNRRRPTAELGDAANFD
jgi:hypothetical protein